MADNEALQDSEQDSLLSGSDSDGEIWSEKVPTGPPMPPQGAANATAGQLPGGGVPSSADDTQEMPQASGRAFFLGNLLRTVLSGGLAGAAQANPAMARGYAAQQQAVQQQRQQQIQAQQQQAQAIKDLDAHQMNIVRMETAKIEQAKMAQMMIHLDDAHNEKMVGTLEKSTEFDRKEGLMQDEQEVDGEGMQAYSTAVKLAGQLNAKQGTAAGERYKVGILDGSDLKHLKFNVYKVNMDGKVTREVFTGKDEDGNPKHQIMTGKYAELDALENANLKNVTQDATKETLKDLHKTLGNQKPPETQDEADFRLSQLNTVLQMHPDAVAKQLAQNEVNDIKKNYSVLPKTQAQAKERQARAGAEIRKEEKESELTSSTRTMAEAAPRVLDFVDRIDQLVDQQAKQLGPAASRWQEFMSGKVGAPNPEFTKLRTDVGLLTTLLMRMHVGARGGEYIMKHFQDLIDTGKQSPENLKAALGEIRTYAQQVAAEKGGMNMKPAPTPARPKGVPASAVWNPEARQWRLPQ